MIGSARVRLTAHQALPLARFAVARALNRKFPLSATLCLTDRCNFRCVYCKVPSLERDEMSTEEWIGAIDELHAAGTLRVSLMGGEPLVRRDIGRIIEHLKSLHMNVAMNTNGWLVGAHIDDVARLDLICVTLDGPREVHDTQRHPGSHDRALAAIDAARTRGVQVVTMTVLTAAGTRHVDYVLDVARHAGFSAFFQLQHADDGDPNRPIGAGLSDDEVESVARHLLKRKEEGAPVGPSRTYLEALAGGARRLHSCAECSGSRYFFAIAPQGDVTACPMTFRRRPAVNGRELGFRRAFETLPQPTDAGCSCYPLNELNYVLRFRAEAMLNVMGQMWGVARP